MSQILDDLTAAIESYGADYVTIPAHQPEGTPDAGRSLLGTLGFKAPDTTLSSRELIRVTLHEWNPDVFTHLLESHSRPDASVEATYVDAVSNT